MILGVLFVFIWQPWHPSASPKPEILLLSYKLPCHSLLLRHQCSLWHHTYVETDFITSLLL